MYFTGFADEAGQSLDLQIQATKELGWNHIEVRNIDGVNITDLSDEKFAEVYDKLKTNGIQVNGFGSTVANWGKDPRKPEDFEKSIAELRRGIPRMQRLGTKMIRGMSFAMLLKDEFKPDPDLERAITEKVKTLVQICEDAGIIYLHENCSNYFSQSYELMERMLDNIDSPSFKIVFDTGNSHLKENRMGEKPYQRQKSWEVYNILRERIHHIHIKDSIFIKDTGGLFSEADFVFPGEGDGEVKRIVKDLLERGYDGGFSIEPHMANVFHNQEKGSKDDEAFAQFQYNNYIEYGRRFMRLVDEVEKEIAR